MPKKKQEVEMDVIDQDDDSSTETSVTEASTPPSSSGEEDNGHGHSHGHGHHHDNSDDERRHHLAETRAKNFQNITSRTGDLQGMSFQSLISLEEIRLKEAEGHCAHTDALDNARESYIFGIIAIIIEIVIIIIIGALGAYPSGEAVDGELELYPFFRDVNIMIFFGFGFLMTFLRRFGYSAIGFTLLISSLVVQYSLVVRGVVLGIESYHNGEGFPDFEISLFSLIDGLFCAGACMISFGATLGKVTPTQLLAIALLEPWIFFSNFVVTISEVGAHDVGGGMTIHTLGAFIGVFATWFTTTKLTKVQPDNTSCYSGDLFSLAGTLFLWLLWPSFNAAIAEDPRGRLLATINTVLSLCGSTLAAFLVSRMSSEKKFDVVHAQNATLAGGVVMGVAADLDLNPGGALASGFVAGALSVLGYQYLTPLLAKFGFQDVCGVINLHGIPGILSAVVSIFATIQGAQPESLGFATNQPGRQLLALLITLGFAIVGGVLIGICMWLLESVRKLSSLLYFNDRAFWVIPSDYHAIVRDDVEFEMEHQKNHETHAHAHSH